MIRWWSWLNVGVAARPLLSWLHRPWSSFVLLLSMSSTFLSLSIGNDAAPFFLLLLFEVPGTGASRCHNRTRMWVPTPPPTRQPLVETHRMCLGSECALFYLFISVFSSFLFFFFSLSFRQKKWAQLSTFECDAKANRSAASADNKNSFLFPPFPLRNDTTT